MVSSFGRKREERDEPPMMAMSEVGVLPPVMLPLVTLPIAFQITDESLAELAERVQTAIAAAVRAGFEAGVESALTDLGDALDDESGSRGPG